MFSFKKVLNISLIVFLVAFSVMFCINKFDNTPLIAGNKDELQIYEWWHIESFEGGGANRKNYLNSLALQYEKSNPTKLFMVKSIEADQLEDALTKSTPHLISFSEQVAKIVLPYLVAFDNEYNIRDNYLESATYNGRLMALPYIASGYCYFTKTNNADDLDLYTANDNLHNALSLTGNTTINNNQTLSSYQCYTKFVNSNSIKLLGTARDLFRIKNLENLGRFSATYEPVSTFTDLVQYLGVTTNDSEVLKFIDFVMQDDNQYKLANLSLFSTKHIKLYTEPVYANMEQALTTCYVPNIFTN
ncbi:MAG: hypothetical protein IJ358_01980 [Clostridia bacterium]|nr:hypothetical protein [Clostridia bacterium]